MTATQTETGTRPPSRRAVRRGLAGVGGIVLLVAGILLLGPGAPGLPYDPGSVEEDGLLGLVRLLGELDVEVRVSDGAPRDVSTRVFVPADQQSDERREALRAFARAGGIVVVAGESALHDLVPVGASFVDTIGRTERRPGCALLEDVGRVSHDGWSGFEVPDGATACFRQDGEAAWLVVVDVGDGHVVALGSPEPFTNGLLAEADNAVLAATLFGPDPGGRLQIVPRGEVGGGSTPLLELVPDGFLRGVWLLAAALVVAVLWRARRLGPPVPERLPDVLPSAELARSVADLLQRAGDRDAATGRIREELHRDARRVLRLPAGTPTPVLVERLLALTRADADDVRLALSDTAARDDAAMTAIAAAAGRVRATLHHLGPYRSPTPTTPDPDAPGARRDPAT